VPVMTCPLCGETIAVVGPQDGLPYLDSLAILHLSNCRSARGLSREEIRPVAEQIVAKCCET
jgi:C4-type Zn-finger protein